jgi:hypothetical protein
LKEILADDVVISAPAVRLRLPQVFPVDLEARAVLQIDPLDDADRDLRMAVVVVDGLGADCRPGVGDIGDHPQNARLAPAGQGMQHRQRAHIIAVGVHVGIENDWNGHWFPRAQMR